MITLFYGSEIEHYRRLADQMFHLRAKVFKGRLDWDVEVIDGVEKDKFDELNPLYAVHTDADGRVVGTFRLLQTTGPTMLREVFHACLPGPDYDVMSPLVWESTRFCVDTEYLTERSDNGLARVTGALLASLLQIGVTAGLSHIVTVIDVRMERILRRAGVPIDRLGPPADIGGVQTLAVLMECSQRWVDLIVAKNRLVTADTHCDGDHKLRLVA